MLQSNMDVSLESLVNSLQSTRSTLLSEIEMLNDTEVNVKPRRINGVLLKFYTTCI